MGIVFLLVFADCGNTCDESVHIDIYDAIYSIAISAIAAVIFYIFNDYIPSFSLRRFALTYNDYELYEIIGILGHLIYIPFICDLNYKTYRRTEFVDAFSNRVFSGNESKNVLSRQDELRLHTEKLFKSYPSYLSPLQLKFCYMIFSSDFYRAKFDCNPFNLDDENRIYYQDNQNVMAESIADLYEFAKKLKYNLR